MSRPILAEVIRSGYPESHHCGSLIVLRADGSRAIELGDLDRPVFPRSSNKPLQAVGLLSAGWAPGDEEEVALASASHNGEDGHCAVVRRMLARAGLTEADLGCPPSLPLHEPTAWARLRSGLGPTALQMNCSGKHAAMVATAVANGWSTAGYLEPSHPVQRAVLGAVERLAGEQVRHVAVDGCGAPQHALTLPGVARAFARLVRAVPGTPEHEVAAAMRRHPWLVGGTDRDVTGFMQAVGGLLAKDGAEGVYAAALPDGSAVAFKIEDGAGRARPPVLAMALLALGVRREDVQPWLGMPVLGGGQPVGEVRASQLLCDAVGAGGD